MLGIYRSNSTEDLRYYSNGQHIQYASWRNDEPDNDSGDEDCVLGFVGQRALLWATYQCWFRVFTLCEV